MYESWLCFSFQPFNLSLKLNKPLINWNLTWIVIYVASFKFIFFVAILNFQEFNFMLLFSNSTSHYGRHENETGLYSVLVFVRENVLFQNIFKLCMLRWLNCFITIVVVSCQIPRTYVSHFDLKQILLCHVKNLFIKQTFWN